MPIILTERKKNSKRDFVNNLNIKHKKKQLKIYNAIVIFCKIRAILFCNTSV